MQLLHRHIEGLIFCASEAIGIKDIQDCLSEMFDAEISENEILDVVKDLQNKFDGEQYSFSIFGHSGGYQFLTKPEYQASIAIFLRQKSNKKLSTSALETLAIIAYKQPITKAGIEQVRGVNCDYSVQKLLEKELLEIQGKADTVGKPLLYGTSIKFMDYFGINSLDELPTPKDFKQEEANEIGKENEA